jgi:hypothetical protein
MKPYWVGIWSWAVSKDPADVKGILKNDAGRGQEKRMVALLAVRHMYDDCPNIITGRGWL